jgi:hypothetical protein
MDEYVVRCAVTRPGGSLLDISDNERYRLAGDTLGNRQVTWRKQEAEGPYVPGSWVVSAVPETIQETVAVYAYGATPAELRITLDRLTECFSQLRYFLLWEQEDDSFVWACQVADYTVDTRREFQHSTMALCTFQVPRYPALLDAVPVLGTGAGGL